MFDSFANMETTLKRVEVKSSFLFGGVKFMKDLEADDELVQCKIYGTNATVYIADHALVIPCK